MLLIVMVVAVNYYLYILILFNFSDILIIFDMVLKNK
jgi:hypothetical protein